MNSLIYENREGNKRFVGLNFDRDVVLSCKEALIESLNWNIHGFALFKTALLIEEVFHEDALTRMIL